MRTIPNIVWEDFTPPRILIIDDNPSVHEAFDQILTLRLVNETLEKDDAIIFGPPTRPQAVKPTYQIEHAMSGAEGVEKVQQAVAASLPYQVAFVDIRMPGLDGVETIERFWEFDSQIQTVICTAYADYRWEDLANRLGQTDRLLVLKKPFHNIEVLQLASTLARKWSLARQAAMKFEQAQRLVARRTQKLLEMQQHETARTPSLVPTLSTEAGTGEAVAVTSTSDENDLPVIMLVGKESAFPSLIRKELTDQYMVMDANDAAEGMGLARENVPDLIVVDADLPKSDGLRLCADLKQDEMTRHIPVVLLASDDSEANRVRVLEAGVDEFLVKPLSWPLLKAHLGSLLGNRRKLHEHFRQSKNVQLRELATNQMDTEFLRRVVEIVEKNLADYEFDVDNLARQMFVSRRQLFRKFKALAGSTPNSFIRSLRLKRAAQLLRESPLTISEVVYAVGFTDFQYFRTIFREQFGVLPGEYQKPSKP